MSELERLAEGNGSLTMHWIPTVHAEILVLVHRLNMSVIPDVGARMYSAELMHM